MSRRGLLGRVIVAVLGFVGACKPVTSPALGTPTQVEWTLARARLTDLRAEEPSHPYVEIVKVLVHEPKSGRTFAARGAIAVDPHRAMRMVLLGPGGATALDVWTTADRWRFEVPALNMLRRGGREADETLPIGFFRWWFLAPLEGRLLTARAKPEASLFVLRDGPATVTRLDEATTPRHVVLASRRAGQALDRLAWSGRRLPPGAGDHALYLQLNTGLSVEVSTESLSKDRPDPAAFADPDAEGSLRPEGATP